MSDVNVWECPNCGSTGLVEITPHKRRCEYCGTTLTSPAITPALLKCPRCGFNNERGALYCNRCSLAITKWTSFGTKTDPAIISIIATFVGSLFVPVGGAILGLILAYKARDQARATSGISGSEGLARTAIIVGWVVLAISVLPICLFPMLIGGSLGSTICGGL